MVLSSFIAIIRLPSLMLLYMKGDMLYQCLLLLDGLFSLNKTEYKNCRASTLGECEPLDLRSSMSLVMSISGAGPKVFNRTHIE